jgi:hypothetical protein
MAVRKRLWAIGAAILLCDAAGAVAQVPAPRTRFQPVASVEACPADRAPIMILGSYHMDNPGLDAVNMQADNVLLERRQAEIATLVTRLARFRPTKVMIEAPFSSTRMQERYQQYRQGGFTLTANEIYQIGFRLARSAGLEAVTPVDFPMWMSGQTYDELDLGRMAPPPPAPANAPPRVPSADELRLRRSTVADYLLYVNEPGRWLPDHLGYMGLLEDDPANVSIYERADQLTNWYKRNFRIWANVVRRTERPRDRVFLLIGAGHLAILRQLAQDMPGFCLVEPAAYLAG